MDYITEIFIWMRDNYTGILISLSVVVGGLEFIVRLTPTKSDDSALKRVSNLITMLMDALKIPNVHKVEKGKIVTHGKK